MAPRFLFVTGTDTGVGKTTLSRALLFAWRRRGLLVAARKPIETGVDENSRDTDAAGLAEAAAQRVDESCFLRLAAPLAPQAAARIANLTIDPRALETACAQVAAPYCLVEGAGGLLVPIAPGYTMADLAVALSAAVLIVARTRLGTINHSLLTIAECRRRGLYVAGVVLNRCDDVSGLQDADNAALIASHGAVPVFGPFPYQKTPQDLDALADAAERHLPVPEIFAACYRASP